MGDQEAQDRNAPAAAIAGLVSDNLEKVAEQARALLVLAGIIAISAGGLAVAVQDRTGRILGLLVFLALMLLIAGLLYRVSTGAIVGKDLASVNGNWWQLVVTDRSPGLTVVRVELSLLPTGHSLGGTKYGPDGKKMSTWRSRAVGLLGVGPVEIFYYWEGEYVRDPWPVSGVGLYKFSAEAREASASGDGWFTTGDVNRGDFSEASRVHLKRVDQKDASILDIGGAEREALLCRRYKDWMEELGASAAVEARQK